MEMLTRVLLDIIPFGADALLQPTEKYLIHDTSQQSRGIAENYCPFYCFWAVASEATEALSAAPEVLSVACEAYEVNLEGRPSS